VICYVVSYGMRWSVMICYVMWCMLCYVLSMF